jgi:hypothetical protein
VAVPQSSPIPPYETRTEAIKHDYATLIKKPVENEVRCVSRFQPMRTSTVMDPSATRTPMPHTTLNDVQDDGTYSLPTTFQPNRSQQQSSDYATTSISENIYTSDVNELLPQSSIDKDENKSLENHLENQSILTDYDYSDYDLKKTTTVPSSSSSSSSSSFHGLANRFTRKHTHTARLRRKTSRCSIM